MPANLPAEARHKWNEVSMARTPQEKLRALREFLSLVPKHKGTERLRARAKRQIAALRREIEERKQRRAGKGGPRFFIEKEGAAQIVILGPTNVGRSSLLASVTNARTSVSSYPFTTLEPVPGMLHYQNLQFQIIEAPPLIKGSAHGEAWGSQTLALARNADGLILMVDLSENPRKHLSMILDELEKAKILTEEPRARVNIERRHMNAGLKVLVLGRLVGCTVRDVEQLLKSYRISDGTVKIFGEATLNDVEDAVFESTVYRPAVVVANKADVLGAAARAKRLDRFIGNRMMWIPVSCKSNRGLEKLGIELFRMLSIIRVYTKEPRKKAPSSRPFILKRGAVVQDLAKQIHSDFYDRFSYAKVWARPVQKRRGVERLSASGRRVRFSPQRVGLDFPLEDGDVVELHTR
ncbi:MAG: 50S ribosome-binding GTPase [Candidatus Bathyarchaeota archaeon]|nr:MAG: 50S ribosome-binding GTPase [Candidatus Bathyarchaeota archaeon]